MDLENEIKNVAKTQYFRFKKYYRYVFTYGTKVKLNEKVYLVKYYGGTNSNSIDFFGVIR